MIQISLVYCINLNNPGLNELAELTRLIQFSQSKS